MDEYQKQAIKSLAITDKNITALAHRSLGLTGEAGIVANKVKKIVRDKDGVAHADDVDEIKSRLGDTLYYVAVLADYFDIPLSEIADDNLARGATFDSRRDN